MCIRDRFETIYSSRVGIAWNESADKFKYPMKKIVTPGEDEDDEEEVTYERSQFVCKHRRYLQPPGIGQLLPPAANGLVLLHVRYKVRNRSGGDKMCIRDRVSGR